MSPAAVQLSPRPTLQALVILAVMLLDIKVRAQGSDCHYLYTEQPLPGPICDPYDAGELVIQCTVMVPADASNISIGWFLDGDQLHNNSTITISSQVLTDTGQQTSRLTIMNMSDRYAGKYTCNLLGHKEFIPSDHFTLSTELEIAACGFNTIQSWDQDKCAELPKNVTIPISLTCMDPVMLATSPGDIIMTSTMTTTMTSHKPFLPDMPKDKKDKNGRGSNKEIGTNTLWIYVLAAVATVLLLILIFVVTLCKHKCIRPSYKIALKDHHNEIIAVGRNPLYGTSSGGLTPSNGMHMRINEGYGAHTAVCTTATDPLHMRINEVYGIQTQPSLKRIPCHNTDMEMVPHDYDYIPLDGAGNTTWPPATSDISAAEIRVHGVTNPLIFTEV